MVRKRRALAVNFYLSGNDCHIMGFIRFMACNDSHLSPRYIYVIPGEPLRASDKSCSIIAIE